ncbi:arylsulfatase [Paludisphaera rhizosphaerae]|uniref:arylsulfatase n=1 Tax=Paludisphaera rhizosphaerae TaxID=2711216 RepID=UPI0013EB1B59|nr:arylsulfatase [Paludisphaera rhizosphaerae]
MPRVVFCWLSSVLVLFLLGVPAPSVLAEDPKPNVLYIMADDLGYGDLGCYGQKLIKTPNIDALAAQGTRYLQAYAGSTVCAPSRSALMTGKHTGHAPIRGNQEVKPEGQVPMPADTFTMAHLFKRAGYTTGLIGKWGLGYPGSVSTPDKMGFDDFYGYNCQAKAHEYYPEYLWKNDQKVMLNGKAYSHDLMAAEALDFVRRNRDRPFFLDLSLTIPHAKLQVPDLGPYANESWPDDLKRLAAMITRMDSDVGRLMVLLDELKIADRTLVFFVSDNGAAYNDQLFQHSGALRGRKRDMYEGGVRTPAILRWPGHVKAGAVSEQVWTFWDLLPTFADLIGVPAPSGLDGVSVLPAFVEGRKIEHPPLYFEFHERGFDQCARIGDWKAVRHGSKGPIELYDLSVDSSEKTDVAAAHPDVVRKFEDYLATARTDSEIWPIRDRVPGQAAQKKAAAKKAATP